MTHVFWCTGFFSHIQKFEFTTLQTYYFNLNSVSLHTNCINSIKLNLRWGKFWENWYTVTCPYFILNHKLFSQAASKTLKKELELQLGLMSDSAQHSVWNPLLMIWEQQSCSLVQNHARFCNILRGWKDVLETSLIWFSILKIIFTASLMHNKDVKKEPTHINFE